MKVVPFHTFMEVPPVLTVCWGRGNGPLSH